MSIPNTFADRVGSIPLSELDENFQYVLENSEGTGGGGNSGAGGAILLNSNSISSSYTFPSGLNGVTAGPIIIDEGVEITIPPGSSWSIV